MEKLRLTTGEFVEMFGDDKQKENFTKTGKLKADTRNSIVKEAKTNYENVEIVKQGRSNVFELSGKRKEKQMKEDKRVSNGAWKIPYTKNLDTMVVAVLELGLEKATAQTLSNWAVDYGIITQEQHDILACRYQEALREQYVKDAKANEIIFEGEDRAIEDYASFIRELIQQLAGTINRMEKLKIIETNKVYNAHTTTGDIVEIHYTIYNKVLEATRLLQELYDVSDWYINTYKNAKKTVEYKKHLAEKLATITVLDENGNEVGITNTFTTYAIMLKARKKKILMYLEKYNPEAIEYYKNNSEGFLIENKKEFGEKRIKHIEDKTQEKVETFLKPRVTNKDMVEVYGGKFNKRVPTIDDYTQDHEYYELYFNETLVKRMSDLESKYGYKF